MWWMKKKRIHLFSPLFWLSSSVLESGAENIAKEGKQTLFSPLF